MTTETAAITARIVAVATEWARWGGSYGIDAIDLRIMAIDYDATFARLCDIAAAAGVPVRV